MCSLYCNITSVDRSVEILNEELNHTFEWAPANVSEINTSKFKCLIIKKKYLNFSYDPVFFFEWSTRCKIFGNLLQQYVHMV